MSFKELLATVKDMQEAEDAQLAKSQAATETDPETPADPAANTEPADPENGTPADPATETDPDADPDDGDPEVLGKSFSFTLEDGTVVEAQDGTALVKSLMAQVGELKAANQALEAEASEAIGGALSLIKSQGERLEKAEELIKSQAAQIAKLSGTGRGRISMLTVSEKVPASTMAKSQPAEEGLTPGQVLAKAQSALQAGKITGLEAVRIETSINQGLTPPADVLAKIA